MLGLARIRQGLVRPLPLLKYLVLTTETHAFCAALAFFALIAFYPLGMLLLSLARYKLQWGPAEGAVLQTLREYYPEAQAFLVRNLEASVAHYGKELQLQAIFWILLGAAGFFIPLENAFNRLWGFPEHRPYWKNQLVGLLLTCGCCVLAVLFVLLTGGLHWIVAHVVPFTFLQNFFRYVALKVVALLFSVAAIFLFYKFLPNGRVRAADAFPAALVAGLVSEIVRWCYKLLLPRLHLDQSQGPYYISISFVLMAYFESFVLLGGAFLAAKARGDTAPAPSVPSRSSQ